MSCQERLPAVKTGLHRCVGGWDSVPYVAGEPCSATQTQLVLGEGKEAEKDIGQKLASSRLLFGTLFLGHCFGVFRVTLVLLLFYFFSLHYVSFCVQCFFMFQRSVY